MQKASKNCVCVCQGVDRYQNASNSNQRDQKNTKRTEKDQTVLKKLQYAEWAIIDV